MSHPCAQGLIVAQPERGSFGAALLRGRLRAGALAGERDRVGRAAASPAGEVAQPVGVVGQLPAADGVVVLLPFGERDGEPGEGAAEPQGVQPEATRPAAPVGEGVDVLEFMVPVPEVL